MQSRWARSFSYLFFRYVLRREYMLAHVPDLDLQLKFKTEDVVGRHIYKRGVHEPALTRFLLEQVRFEEGDIVLDIGANIGWFSLLLDRVLPEGARVYAFEPDPENFELLTHNLNINQATKVVPVNIALSDAEETKVLYRYSTKNLGKHSLLPSNTAEQVPVQTTTLDAFWDRHIPEDRVPRFIKIDIEGYEYFALKGALHVLEHCPLVVAEHAAPLIEKGGLEPEAVVDLLTAAGFQPHLFEDGEIVPTLLKRIAASDKELNVFWLRMDNR